MKELISIAKESIEQDFDLYSCPLYDNNNVSSPDDTCYRIISEYVFKEVKRRFRRTDWKIVVGVISYSDSWGMALGHFQFRFAQLYFEFYQN
jgi:hypothetical protein